MTAPILLPIPVPTGEIAVRGPFDLTAASRYLAGFGPAGRPDAAVEPGVLRLAFPVDGVWTHAGATIRQRSPGTVEVEVSAPVDVAPRVMTQVSRMLSLDVDAAGLPDVDRRDSVAARLRASWPGLRPVLFSSPYEAACWSVLSQGMRFTQAMKRRRLLAERHGRIVDVGEYQVVSFPAPAALAELASEEGLADFRVARLRSVAQAALDGRLDPAALRGVPVPEALAGLCAIPGLGRFSAEQILIRAVGHPDLFPRADGRLHAAMREEYGLPDSVPPDQLERLADDWRPYRSWVALLFRATRDAVPPEAQGAAPETVSAPVGEVAVG
ncbi:DNA-3-methyladenine glycosylase family protein [Amycolatopsis sp. NPDC051903]|uniref:DNA-3-methyladenine glycosylase family protein n=1 Tax=Amycolatopsis sp. NPDC051903 TaxID=3363936 RepID=UPI0037A8B303